MCDDDPTEVSDEQYHAERQRRGTGARAPSSRNADDERHARDDQSELDAGHAAVVQVVDERILRAEFTPTTEFCPQSDTLSLGAFRAWNGDPGRHEFDLVRVRVAPMHHQAVAINGKLLQAESQFTETGDLARPERGDVRPDDD